MATIMHEYYDFDSRFEVQALLLHKGGCGGVDILEDVQRNSLCVWRLGRVHLDRHVKHRRRRPAGTAAFQTCNTSAAKEQEDNARDDSIHPRCQSTLNCPVTLVQCQIRKGPQLSCLIEMGFP